MELYRQAQDGYRRGSEPLFFKAESLPVEHQFWASMVDAIIIPDSEHLRTGDVSCHPEDVLAKVEAGKRLMGSPPVNTKKQAIATFFTPAGPSSKDVRRKVSFDTAEGSWETTCLCGITNTSNKLDPETKKPLIIRSKGGSPDSEHPVNANVGLGQQCIINIPLDKDLLAKALYRRDGKVDVPGDKLMAKFQVAVQKAEAKTVPKSVSWDEWRHVAKGKSKEVEKSNQSGYVSGDSDNLDD
jgi:hypothetical protein